jgi:hypothetical protein
MVMVAPASVSPAAVAAIAAIAADEYLRSEGAVEIGIVWVRIGIWAGIRIGARASVLTVWAGTEEHAGDDLLIDSSSAQVFHVHLAQTVDRIGLVDVMDDEPGGDGTVGEFDDIVQGKRIAVEHFVINVLGDVMSAENGPVLLVDGLTADKKNGNEKQGENAQAFHIK